MRCSGTQFDCTESPLSREVFYQAEHLERSHSDGYHPGDEHRTHREREEEDRQIYKQPSEVSHLGIFRFTDRAGFWPEAGASGYKNSGKMDTIASKMGFPG